MTGLASSTSAIRVPSASAASSSSASTVISTCLPIRSAGDGRQPERRQRVDDRLPRGVEDLGLEHHVDDDLVRGHGRSVAVRGRLSPRAASCRTRCPVSRS